MRKIAIIGAASGQLPICLKAKEMGLETYCFAWEEGAICKDYVDHFIPISIFEMDEIVELCKKYNISGVVSNASEATALVSSYIAEKLNLVCTPYNVLKNIQNKEFVRSKTNDIDNLGKVFQCSGKVSDIVYSLPFPFVIKPITGSAKKGVNFIMNEHDINLIPEDLKAETFVAEQYIDGNEYSVESLSYRGCHDVVVITQKITTGPPHFVELEHHQPADLQDELVNKIKEIIPSILTSIGFENGASHTEIKVDSNNNIYLIEVNPRGGGDFISNNLIALSTDCDYLREIILIALGEYHSKKVNNIAYSGVYFLNAYTKRILQYFTSPVKSWMIDRQLIDANLTESKTNYDRNGYIIYKSQSKIIL